MSGSVTSRGRRRALRSGSRVSAKGALGPGHQRQKGEREGARVGRGERGNGPGKGEVGKLGLGWFPWGGVSFFYFFSFLVSFPKHSPNRILKAQFISKQKQSTQNKICLNMNAQNHVTKLMINFNFPKII